MSVVAIGNFDGLHLGHQALLRKVIELAGKKLSIVYTFSPHPKNAPRLMSDLQKSRAIKQFGISQVIFQQFTPQFASLIPEEFIQHVLVDQLHAHHVVVGSNFAFGASASGNIQTLLASHDFETHIVRPVTIDGQICSSSLIRKLISDGDLDKVKRYLGRDNSLSGPVIKGAGRGSQIGFPTANIQIEQEILPPLGVYATYSETLGKSVTNIGKQPTFGSNNLLQIETHFLDFSGSLYGQNIEIFFKYKIRDEKKFNSVEELKTQIQKDIFEST